MHSKRKTSTKTFFCFQGFGHFKDSKKLLTKIVFFPSQPQKSISFFVYSRMPRHGKKANSPTKIAFFAVFYFLLFCFLLCKNLNGKEFEAMQKFWRLKKKFFYLPSKSLYQIVSPLRTHEKYTSFGEVRNIGFCQQKGRQCFSPSPTEEMTTPKFLIKPLFSVYEKRLSQTFSARFGATG